MEEHQFTNGSSGSALCEDVLDEDETRLIIDEGCLSSEDNHGKVAGEVPKFIKLKSKKDVQETSNAYPCPDCGKMFKRKVKLQAHLLTHKSKEEMECENCGKKFRKVDALFNHVCSGFGNNYKCPDCDEWFRLKKDLTIHQQSHRKSSTSEGTLDEKNPSEELDFSSFVASFVKWPITCTHCGVDLANLEDYNVHMAAHKEGQPCVCSVCKMKFSCNDDYLLHKDLCHIEGIFECTCCNKRFHTEKKLSDHLESHNEDGVCCDICDVSFVSKDKLLSHMKVHKMNIFVCGKCKKIFKCNSSFKNHTCSIPDNSEKKFYTFADPSEKKVNEQYLDSMSVNNESDSEDADTCQLLSESHVCKVCGDSFKQKEDLNLHLTNHFQCIECKKYFKRQTDLDMHVFLLAEEKLYSCCLCEAIVHGKKELEYHLSQHLAGDDDVPLDDSEWDDNTDGAQNGIPNFDITEHLPSNLLERSLADVKLHKVIPAGNNALKCSSCGKLVLRHHTLSAHMEPNTPVIDSDEEYVYISRLGTPQNKIKQTEESFCTCQHKFTILPSLGEQSPSKSLSEYECQEVQKLIDNSLHQSKSILEESGNSKSKSLLSEDTEDSSVGQMDVSNDNGSNSDRPNDFEVLKPETKTSKTLLISNQLLNRDSTDSPASSISDHLAKNDTKNRSDLSKLTLHNTELVDKKDASSSQKPSIKIFKLNSKVPPSLPKKAVIKDVVLSTNTVSGNVVVTKPVKILISTGISGTPTFNLEPQPELLNGSDGKMSVSPLKNSTTKRSLPDMNLVNQEELILHSLTGDDVGKSFQVTPGSISKKIKQEKSTKKVPLRPKVGPREYIPILPKGKLPLRASSKEILTTEFKPQNGKNEKIINVNHQVIPRHSTIEVKTVQHARKSNTLSKTDPMLRANDKKPRPPRRRTTFRKREQGKHKSRPDPSTSNGSGSEPSYIPEANMIFKVEQLGYDSEEEEEEEEESLDFSGIKKEFLASDVFIKEEEWDIVDF